VLSTSQIKEIKSLQVQKFRKLQRQFVVEGVKMVDELLRSSFEVIRIYATENWINTIGKVATSGFANIQQITHSELQRISQMKSPNEVLAIVKIPDNESERLIFDDFVLMLDQIADPGNLGTIIRIADWFGIRTIICSPDTVELYNPKVIQATMGSVFRVHVHYASLPEVIQNNGSGLPVYGALLDGENIFQQQLSKKAILVIGNESHGISDAVRSLIDYPVKIPSMDSGAESLNASVATAVMCAEFRRGFWI